MTLSDFDQMQETLRDLEQAGVYIMLFGHKTTSSQLQSLLAGLDKLRVKYPGCFQ